MQSKWVTNFDVVSFTFMLPWEWFQTHLWRFWMWQGCGMNKKLNYFILLLLPQQCYHPKMLLWHLPCLENAWTEWERNKDCISDEMVAEEQGIQGGFIFAEATRSLCHLSTFPVVQVSLQITISVSLHHFSLGDQDCEFWSQLLNMRASVWFSKLQDQMFPYPLYNLEHWALVCYILRN